MLDRNDVQVVTVWLEGGPAAGESRDLPWPLPATIEVSHGGASALYALGERSDGGAVYRSVA